MCRISGISQSISGRRLRTEPAGIRNRPPEAIRKQVDVLVAKHRGVRFIFAHLAMPDRDLKWLSRLLKTHSQIFADLSAPCTAGLLVRQREYARQFIERFANQLCFGTDTIITPGRSAKQIHAQYTASAGSLRRIFESSDEINWFFRQSYRGLALSPEILKRLLFTNFHRLAGQPQVDISHATLLAILNDAANDLHKLEGVTNADEFDRLSKQAVLHRERAYAEQGTIADTVFQGGTISELYRTAALEMFQRVKQQ